MKKTSHHIFGYWFHITWENNSVGYDQRGTKWNNIKTPTCSNPVIAPLCETYHTIISTILKSQLTIK